MLAYGHYTILKPLYWCMLVSIYININQSTSTSNAESLILYWCVLVSIYINRYSWSQFIAWKYSEVMEKRTNITGWSWSLWPTPSIMSTRWGWWSSWWWRWLPWPLPSSAGEGGRRKKGGCSQPQKHFLSEKFIYTLSKKAFATVFVGFHRLILESMSLEGRWKKPYPGYLFKA